MKSARKYLAAILAVAMACPLTMPLVNYVRADGAGVAIDETNFPDAIFRSYVEREADRNRDGYLSDEEIARIDAISIEWSDVRSLEGIEYFTEIKSLLCRFNQLTSLDISANPLLERVYCNSNQITSLDVSNQPALKELYCSDNLLTSLDISNNTALVELFCDNNQLTSIDTSNNTLLNRFECYDNQITGLDVSANTQLDRLNCYNNQLTSLDVSSNILLTILNCSGNQLTSIDVSANSKLQFLECNANQLTSIDVSSNSALQSLGVDDNLLTSIDVSNNHELASLYCVNNSITELDVSHNPEMMELICAGNPLTSLDISRNSGLTAVDISQTDISVFDISGNSGLLESINDEETYFNNHDNFNPCTEEIFAGGTFGHMHTADDYSYYYHDYMYYGYLTFTKGQGIIFEAGAEPVYPAGAPEPDPASGVEDFIARLYSEVLGREADRGGINYWVDQLNNGTTGGDAAKFFLCSEEFLNNAMSEDEFVGVLYAVFFDRTPDEGGLAYWMSEVAGKGKTAVIDSLIESQEWANICETYGIATGAGGGSTSSDPIVAFCERLYTTCLGRSGEQGGIDFWSAELRAGRSSGSDAARGFFFGSEFMNAGHGDTEFVTRLYRTFFNREPDAGGLNYWLGELDNGTSRDVAFATFTGCQEWLDACRVAGIQP